MPTLLNKQTNEQNCDSSYVATNVTAVHLLPLSSSLWHSAAEATAADGCLLSVLPQERFYLGVTYVHIKHTVYNKVIGQLPI